MGDGEHTGARGSPSTQSSPPSTLIDTPTEVAKSIIAIRAKTVATDRMPYLTGHLRSSVSRRLLVSAGNLNAMVKAPKLEVISGKREVNERSEMFEYAYHVGLGVLAREGVVSHN